jgi:hypothetical protein
VPTQAVNVNILPWARVRIVPATAGTPVPDQPLVTPFSIQLPAGDYRLECENDVLRGKSTFPIRVVAGRTLDVTRSMTGFDADQVVQALLGDQR